MKRHLRLVEAVEQRPAQLAFAALSADERGAEVAPVEPGPEYFELLAQRLRARGGVG